MDRDPVQPPDPHPGDVLAGLDLPPEVSMAEAARVLGVDKKTVEKYRDAKLLEWRNIAPPGSNRPTYRYTLRSVLAIRTTYQRGNPGDVRAAAPAIGMRSARCGQTLTHFSLRR